MAGSEGKLVVGMEGRDDRLAVGMGGRVQIDGGGRAVGAGMGEERLWVGKGGGRMG